MEVITELLTRLPVKSLLRFRCVSKRWCALIDGQDFVKAHLYRSLNNEKLILGGTITLRFLDPDDFADINGTKWLDTPFKKPCFTWLWGSCNGLLLLQRDDDICLLNPSTKKFVNLPYFPVEYSDCDDDDYLEKENYGLGYDLINDDYKVVKIVEFRDEGGEWVGSKTRVYSLKSNSWGRIRDFPYCLPENRPMWGAFVGGALHTNVLKNLELIVGFDLSREDYFLVPLPECFDKEVGSLHVMVLGGCLCLLGGYTHHRTDVWVMKEYRVKESWTKLFTIAPPTVEPYLSVVPLVYSGDGSEVLLNHDNKRLIWYDLKRGTVRNAPVQNLPPNFYADVFVESLVPLRGFDVMKKQRRQVKTKGKKDNKKSDGFLSTGFKLKL